MIRKFKNEENLQMNVFLKNKKKYLNCDMTTAGETVGVCKFWFEDTLMIIPWSEISRVEIFETN